MSCVCVCATTTSPLTLFSSHAVRFFTSTLIKRAANLSKVHLPLHFWVISYDWLRLCWRTYGINESLWNELNVFSYGVRLVKANLLSLLVKCMNFSVNDVLRRRRAFRRSDFVRIKWAYLCFSTHVISPKCCWRLKDIDEIGVMGWVHFLLIYCGHLVHGSHARWWLFFRWLLFLAKLIQRTLHSFNGKTLHVEFVEEPSLWM